MKIKVNVDPKENQNRKEFAEITLKSKTFSTPYYLDFDFVPFLKFFDTYQKPALDFLFLSSIVYVIDKIVPRMDFEDNWTRDIELEIPLSEPDKWEKAKSDLENILSFLSGDYWKLEFTTLKSQLYRRTRKKEIKKILPVNCEFDGVSLFSGGLDSLVGAIDWLENNNGKKILFVSHHDGNISGPGSVQNKLIDQLEMHFPGRIWHLQSRISQIPLKNRDHNYRSRSLLYMAMGIFAANSVKSDIPLWVPENGSISLNYPLSACRIGSLSTRTVHPHYVEELNKFLQHLGINNSVVNPFKLKTKGEVVTECSNRSEKILKETVPISVSCAKGRRGAKHWHKRSAKACGICLPCIYRRAALDKVGLEDLFPDYYGNELKNIDLDSGKDSVSGLKALVSLIRRKRSKDEIKKTLFSTCKIPFNELDDYADVVIRTLAEVEELLRKSGVI